MKKMIETLLKLWRLLFSSSCFPKELRVYNIPESRVYFLHPRKMSKAVRDEFMIYDFDLSRSETVKLYTKSTHLADPFRDTDEPALILYGKKAEAVWTLTRTYGHTSYYSRSVTLPGNQKLRKSLQEILGKEELADLLAFDRTGISPVPIEIIMGTASLYGQIDSSNEKKRERAKEAKVCFEKRLEVYKRLKLAMLKAGFNEPDQFYRKVRRDYEFLRNIDIMLQVVANRILEIKRAANENLNDELTLRSSALKPWEDLKGKDFFRGAMVISSFLLGGGAATYMLSVKDELLQYLKTVSPFPTTIYGGLILAAGTLALLGQTIFDVIVKRIERSIWNRTGRRLASIKSNEYRLINIELRKFHLYVYEQMAKYHYIEDLELNAPRFFVQISSTGQWEKVMKIVRKAQKYLDHNIILRIFTGAKVRKLAKVRPY